MRIFTAIRPATVVAFFIFLNYLALSAQTDPRFGSVGREGAVRLNLQAYREYQRQNDEALLPGKQKHFVVGQLTSRSDTLGVDWEWYVLDLLEQPNSLLLQNFLNLAIDLIESNAIPVVQEAWEANRDELAARWKQTVDGTSKTWSKKVLGVTIYSYTVRLSDTAVDLPEQLPAIQLTVAPDGQSINLQVDLNVRWSTQAQGTRKTIHAWPTFDTKLSLLGTIEIGKDAKGRYLAIKELRGQSVTDAQGDIKFKVNILGIGDVSFTWGKLDLIVQTQIDKAIASGAGEIMKIDENKDGQPDLAQHFYFEPFLSKTFFAGKPLPKQQDILDRVFARESKWIHDQIDDGRQYGAVWEIGNEPNWFPLLRPEQYAAIYARYYRQIKKYDPSAQCMIGGLFLQEALDDPREIILAGIPTFFGNFRNELATFVTASLFQTSTAAWFEAFRLALPNDVKVDIGNFHVYPMRSQETAFKISDAQPHIERLAASFISSGITNIWVSEFGNIDWRRTEAEAAKLCWELSNYFSTNTVGIQRWFWSRSVGYDRRFDTIGQKPISALLAADGKTLTTIGRMYQVASEDGGRKAVAFEHAETQNSPPQKLSLAPSYPNPFSISRSPATRLVYALPEESDIRLNIYDVLGRLTRQIVAARQSAGTYEILWDGRNEHGEVAASGIYFSVLHAGAQRRTQKIVMTR